MISGELAGFLQQGLSLHIGVRDEHLQPDGARALAARVAGDGRHLIVYLAEPAASRILPHLRKNGQAAVAFARPVDDRACQVKGTFVDARPVGDDEERALLTTQWNGFLDQLEQIGVTRKAALGWAIWPAVAVRLRVTSVFEQTPGARAGTQLV
jgi:hypothetical protein